MSRILNFKAQLGNLPRLGVAAVCAYETFAILSKKSPTISKFCWQYKLLIPVVLTGLAVHLFFPPADEKK